MADLDDFFAKKDKKKKGKKGTKYAKANTDILQQNLIENERKEDNAEKKAAAPFATSEANKAGEIKDNAAAEEEWKEVEEVTKDYSNLKIQTLKVEEESDLEGDEEHEINEETGEKVKVKKGDGPWNKVAGSGAKAKIVDSPPEKSKEQKKEPKKEEEAIKSSASVTSSYVPPHMRGGSSTSDIERRGGPGGRMNRSGKNAPNLNEFNFPSLSDSIGGPKDGSKEDNRDSEKDFETARRGGSQQQRIYEAPKLALDNKFSALRN